MTSDDAAVTPDGEAHPDDQSGANRQFIIGGVVVALTLAVAAWLAYGVVLRASPSPRAAGLVPDGSASGLRGGSHGSSTSPGATGHDTSTTAKPGTTTTHKRSTSTRPGSSATFPDQPPAVGTRVPFATLWHAYSQAWVDECKSIWKNSTNGKLYDPDDVGSAYTINDCTRTLDSLFLTTNVTTVPLAEREGRNDAASFTAQLTLRSELCWIDPATDQIRGCWTGD